MGAGWPAVRMFKGATSAALLALVGACATSGAVDAPLSVFSPLAQAVERPVETLRSEAEAGDASAQYALSILAEHGLRGVPADRAAAADLRRRALAARGFTTITQYIPGLNGAPGRTAIINTPRYDLPGVQARLIDRCVAAVNAGKAAGQAACGRAEVFDWLRNRWAGGDAPAPLVWRAGVLTCEDRAVTALLWAEAARAFDAGRYASAALASDRIIAVCGEAEPSWHPRVMRALIAVQDGEARRALQLLRPVPRPAPRPIGAYSSWVAMRAHAAAKDASGFARERGALMSAAERALAGRGGTERERFTAGEHGVVALNAVVPLGPLVSRHVFLVTPRDPRADPRAIYLTTGEDALGSGRPAWFLDEYRCNGRSTLRYFPASAAGPDYAEVRRLVVDRLEGRLAATSASAFRTGLSACMFPDQVAPGLGG